MKIFGFEIKKAAERVPVRDKNMQHFNFTYGGGMDGKGDYSNSVLIYSVVRYILREITKTQFYLTDSNNNEIEKSEILDLINKPNPLMGTAEFLEKVFAYKLLRGESFIYLASPDAGINKGKPQEMWVIDPKQVKIIADVYGVPTSYKIGYSDQLSITVTPEKIIHLKYFNPDPTSLRGLSPLTTASLTVQQSQLAYKNNLATLEKGGIQGLFVYNSDNEFDDFDEIKQAALEQKWEQKNAEKSIMVTNAKLKWEKVGLTQTDMQLLDTIKYSLRDICNIYGISSQLMNDPDNKTYSNLKEARIEFINNIIIPELELFVDELNRNFIPTYGDFKLNINTDIYPELKEHLMNFVDSLSKSYWLTANERREALGYGRVEQAEMDEIYVPNNLTPLEIAGINTDTTPTSREA